MKPVYTLSPEAEEKIKTDMEFRLGPNGIPVHKGNDYERHLFARYCRLKGMSRDEVRIALFGLGLDDISPSKRSAYVEDVLSSILVGFDNTAPIYE